METSFKNHIPLLVVVCIVVGIAAVYWHFMRPERILQRQVNSEQPLSEEEKQEVFDALSDNKVHELNLSRDEKFELIRKFNTK